MNIMTCYFNAFRITWTRGISTGRGRSPSPLLSLATQKTSSIHFHQLRRPLYVRYQSTNAEASSKSKWYNFMTKSRIGVGSLSIVCGHASSMCTVLAYCNTDMLELRCLALSSGVLAMTFQYFRPQPLWIPIRWGCLLFCINGIMIAQLLLERHRANNMSPELLKIYREGRFDERGFSKVQFVKFFSQARRTVFVANEMICQEGKEMNKLYYILDGEPTVKCIKDGRTIATMSPQSFIGELSYLLFVQGKRQQQPKKVTASANVIANDGPVHVMVWDFDKLSDLMIDDRDLSNAFAVYSSHDLRHKLLTRNAAGYIKQNDMTTDNKVK